MRSRYSSQDIVWSLTAPHWRSLLRITRNNPPQRAAGRTTAEGRTAAAGDLLTLCLQFGRLQIEDPGFFKFKKKKEKKKE